MKDIVLRFLHPDGIKLDQSCWVCHGGTKEPDKTYRKKNGTCEYCNGKGAVPTEAGEAILDFVKRHKDKINDED